MKNLKRGWILHVGGDLPLTCPLCVNLVTFMLLDYGTGQGPGKEVTPRKCAFPESLASSSGTQEASCREV